MKTSLKISRCDPGKGCRVMTPRTGAKGRTTTPAPPRGLRTIMVPVDFSARTERAVEHALTLPGRTPPQLVLFSAAEAIALEMDYGYGPVTRQIPDPLAVEKVTTRLRAYARRSVPAKRLAGIEVGNGDPVDELVRVARERDVGCIVICTRKQPHYDAAGVGVSTAEQLIHRAPCPVIVLHEE